MMLRIELSASRMPGECSTTELQPQPLMHWILKSLLKEAEWLLSYLLISGTWEGDRKVSGGVMYKETILPVCFLFQQFKKTR